MSMVALGYTICPVTLKKNESDELLMKQVPGNPDQILIDGFSEEEKEFFTGWKICDEVANQIDDGFFCLVAVDEEQSTFSDNGNLLPENAHRTGEVAYLKLNIAKQVLNVDLPERGYTFCDQAVIEKLRKMDSQAQKNVEKNLPN